MTTLHKITFHTLNYDDPVTSGEKVINVSQTINNTRFIFTLSVCQTHSNKGKSKIELLQCSWRKR